MIFSLLLACEPGRDTSSTDEPVDTGPFDAAGDGVFTPDDCLDDNADAYPGAEDPPGDDVDADCDGLDGLPFEGCSQVEVPDLYATVDDAVLAGDVNICLGAGEFTPAGIGDVGMLDFSQKKRCMQSGIEATQKAVPALRKAIDVWIAAHSQPVVQGP